MVDGTWWRFWMRPHNLGLTCLIPAPVACVPIKACRVRAPRHKTFLLNFEKWREALFQRAEFSQNVITWCWILMQFNAQKALGTNLRAAVDPLAYHGRETAGMCVRASRHSGHHLPRGVEKRRGGGWRFHCRVHHAEYQS